MSERASPRVPRSSRRQCGLFTAAQAEAEGWTGRQVRRRIEAGAWVRVAGRALAAAGTPRLDSPHTLARAALLTWPEAVVARRAAAAVLGFPVRWTGPVEVHVRPTRRARGVLKPLPGEVPTEESVSISGLRVTDRRRTAVDCLAFLPFEEAMDLYAWLVSRDQLDRRDLAAAARAAYSKPGVVQLRRLLAATRGGAVSAAEIRMHRILRRGGLTGWRPNARIVVRGRIVAVADVLFEQARLIVEVDGLAAHATAERLQSDLQRQNALVRAGYQVLRYTWRDLVDRPDEVLAEISAALQDSARAS